MASAPEVVITYETLFELYRREKNRDELQKLDPSFFERALAYLKGLKHATGEMSDEVIERNRTLALNIKKLLRDIYGRRERKTINMALIAVVTPQSLIDTASFLEHEKLLFESLCDVLKLKRLQVLSQMENNEHPAFSLVSRVSDPALVPVSSSLVSSFSASAPPVASSSAATVSSAEDSDLEKIRLQFREDQPKFIGPNLEIYGPYTIGDMAELPKIIADIILETGKAVMV